MQNIDSTKQTNDLMNLRSPNRLENPAARKRTTMDMDHSMCLQADSPGEPGKLFLLRPIGTRNRRRSNPQAEIMTAE
jgi:hypothetical protein